MGMPSPLILQRAALDGDPSGVEATGWRSLRFRYGVEELNYSRFQDVFAPHYEELIFADELLEKF